MKNINIKLLSSILSPIQLDIPKSSARRRLLRVLNPFVDDYNEELKLLQGKYGEKDPKTGGIKVLQGMV